VLHLKGFSKAFIDKGAYVATFLGTLFPLAMSFSFHAICPNLTPLHIKQSHKGYFYFAQPIKDCLSFPTNFENS